MRIKNYAALGAASAAGALALATMAAAAPQNPDARDARIEELEREVQQLLTADQKLQADDEAIRDKAQALESEVEQLRRGQQTQIEELENQGQAVKQAEASIPPKPSVISDLISGRPVLASADKKFTITAHAVMQLDTGAYFQAAAGPTATDLRRDGPALGATVANVDAAHARELRDGTDFRRARLGIDGTIWGDWDYRFLLDFGGSGVENTGQLYETWIQYSALKPLRFRAGAFPPTVGMEDSASTNGMPFMERSAVEDITRALAAGDTRLSAQAYAYEDRWLASLAITGRTIGVVNTGTAAGVPQTFGDQLGLVGRIAFTPIRGKDWLVNLGVHGSYVIHPANTAGPAANGAVPITAETLSFSDQPQLRIDGTKFLNTGNIDARHGGAIGGEFAAQKANVLVQAEYENFEVQRTDIASDPSLHGYYGEALWTITGEPRVFNRQTRSFDAPIPTHPFSWSGGTWGAWELGVRYADMNLDFDAGLPGTPQPVNGIRGGEEQNVSLDLNWYPNAVIKFMLDYEHVRIDRLSPNAAIFLTPVGAQIGQTFDAVAVRSQFAF